MKFEAIFSLIILISCFNVNKNETNFDNSLEYLYNKLGKEINNFDILHKTTEQYVNELQNQKNYIKFIESINNKYYYPFENQKFSLDLEHLNFPNIINNKSCFFNYLLINEQKVSLLCIDNLYNSLSLYNLNSKEENNNTKVFEIPLSLNLNYSDNISVSFSPFDEEETKIFIFNREKIYSIHLKLNYSLDNFILAYVNNFTVEDYNQDNLLYISTVLYHGNRYILYGYENGECKVYLIKDKYKDNYISTRTVFNLNQKIYKMYQTQGYLFIINEDRKKIRILSLLGSNSILINCYSFNEIIDIVFDYKNNLLFILDNKGTLIIKELSLSVSKAYTNSCNSIYSLQIPYYIIQNNLNSNETIKLFMSKNSNSIYILGKNYLGFVNDKYELENYIIYNQNNEQISDNNILYSKGNTNFLISKYNNEIIIYKINQIKKENSIKAKSNKGKEKSIYNIIDDNSGVVQCNGNLICKLLFNSFTNNKYTINTLYITCLIIIISTVYYFRKSTKKNKNFKSFKEDDLNNEEKGYKFSNMFEKMKNLKNFEMFSEYKKKQRNNRQEEDYKDYYGDEDDNDIDANEKDKEENEEEFLSKAYQNYVNNMMKKKMGDNEEDEEYEGEEIDDFKENNDDYDRNQFEERKGHDSDED